MAKDVASALVLTDTTSVLELFIYKGPSIPWGGNIPNYVYPYSPSITDRRWDCFSTGVSSYQAVTNDVGVGGAAPVEKLEEALGPLDQYTEAPAVVTIHLVTLSEAQCLIKEESRPSGPFLGVVNL
jgi:hypothetical protein